MKVDQRGRRFPQEWETQSRRASPEHELDVPLVRFVPVPVQQLYDRARAYARMAAERGEDWDWLRKMSACYLRSAKRRRAEEVAEAALVFGGEDDR